MNKTKFLHLLIIFLTPILIITTGMRIALSPLFVNLEYRLPNFPPDPFGFTLADRLQWADFSIKFIAGRFNETTFSQAAFPGGDPLFNAREISHMVDVRDLTVIMLWVWRILVMLFLILFFSPKKILQRQKLLQAMGSGAKVTIGIIVGVLLFLAINFDQLFTGFHRLFFEGDTWLFYYSDTLIRLFPLKFWQDLFIFIGALSFAFSVGTLLLSRKKEYEAAS